MYIASNRRLSAKIVPTFVGGVCLVVSVTDPYGRILGYVDRDSKPIFVTVNNNTFCFATIDKVFYYLGSVLTTCFGPYYYLQLILRATGCKPL
jgi:hypothetical protein